MTYWNSACAECNGYNKYDFVAGECVEAVHFCPKNKQGFAINSQCLKDGSSYNSETCSGPKGEKKLTYKNQYCAKCWGISYPTSSSYGNYDGPCVPAVDCIMSQWALSGSCITYGSQAGKQKWTRSIITSQDDKGQGKACGDLTKYEACTPALPGA